MTHDLFSDRSPSPPVSKVINHLSFAQAREQILRHAMSLEKERHRCEVQHIAAWRDKDGRPDFNRMNEFFSGAEAYRGKAAIERLREDVRLALKRRRK